MCLPDYNSDENFCRVYLIPNVLPKDFHFGGGTGVIFKEVDWFYPIPPTSVIEELGMEENGPTWEQIKKRLITFMKGKRYYDPSRTYLVLTYWGEAFMFGAPLKR